MTPPDHNGPFVTNERGPGLLRRLLAGGSNDPAAPHEHTEESTSQMHERRPASRTRGTGTGGGLGFRALMWIVRRMGVRLTIAAVAGVMILIGSFGDDGELNQATRDLQDIGDRFAESPIATPAPAPAVAEPITQAPNDSGQGAMPATIERVFSQQVTIVDMQGTPRMFVVVDGRVRTAVVGNLGERVVLHWQASADGDVEIVGVAGPKGVAMPLPAADAA